MLLLFFHVGCRAHGPEPVRGHTRLTQAMTTWPRPSPARGLCGRGTMTMRPHSLREQRRKCGHTHPCAHMYNNDSGPTHTLHSHALATATPHTPPHSRRLRRQHTVSEDDTPQIRVRARTTPHTPPREQQRRRPRTPCARATTVAAT